MKASLPRLSPGTVTAVAALLAVAAACFVYADRAAPGRKAEERVDEWSESKPPHWRLVTRVWLPRAATINGWLALAAAAAVPWARRPLGGPTPPESRPDPAVSGASRLPEDSPRVRRLGWAAMALVAGLAAWSTGPRLGQSLWGDEARTLREFIVGQYHADDAGRLTFDEATWGDAFFNFRTPNNHVLFSVTARAAHRLLARPSTKPDAPYFSEWAMRLPAWLAGLGAIFSVAGLGAAFGWRRAGWVAAALLAMHPGFIRYAAEARGYAFLLAFGPLLLIALGRAVRTGCWRWWAMAAVLDFALVYTWPLGLHAVVVANLGAVAAVVFGRGRAAHDRVTLVLRWGLTALAAGAVWLQLFLPNLIQLRFWLRGESARGVPGDGGWIDALGTLLTGRVWHDADATNPLLTPWLRTWQSHPWLVGLTAVLVAAVLLAGAVAVWRRTPFFRWWLPALVVPPAVILIQAALSGSVLYPWYLMAAVPGVLLLMAIGLDTTAARLTASPAGRTAVLAAAVLGFALTGAQTRAHLRQHPIEPNREASLTVQPVINPHHPEYHRHVLTAGFLMRNTIYDPGVRAFETAAQLRDLIDEAARTGRDCVVIYGQRELARQVFPEIMALLDDPAVFEPVATLHGQEAYCTRHVVRHRATR
jgi:hypothetical protein